MTSKNNVLTVSYGAFSCTLEGFDDSFAIVSVLANYFSDLAQKDPLFGAHPPQIDKEFLTALAQNELRQNVDMEVSKNSIKMRPTALENNDEKSPAQPAPKTYLSSVAQRLAQIRNATLQRGPDPSADIDDYDEDLGIDNLFRSTSEQNSPLVTKPQESAAKLDEKITTKAPLEQPKTQAIPQQETQTQNKPTKKVQPPAKTQAETGHKPSKEPPKTPFKLGRSVVVKKVNTTSKSVAKSNAKEATAQEGTKPNIEPKTPKKNVPSTTIAKTDPGDTPNASDTSNRTTKLSDDTAKTPAINVIRPQAVSKDEPHKAAPSDTKQSTADTAKEPSPAAPNPSDERGNSKAEEKTHTEKKAQDGAAKTALDDPTHQNASTATKPQSEGAAQGNAPTQATKAKDSAPADPAAQGNFKPKVISSNIKIKSLMPSKANKVISPSATPATDQLQSQVNKKASDKHKVDNEPQLKDLDTASTDANKDARSNQNTGEAQAPKTVEKAKDWPLAQNGKTDNSPAATSTDAPSSSRKPTSGFPRPKPSSPQSAAAPLDLSAYIKRQPSRVIEHPSVHRQNVASTGNAAVDFSDPQNIELSPALDDTAKTDDVAKNEKVADENRRINGENLKKIEFPNHSKTREYEAKTLDNGKRVLRMNGEDFIRAVEQGRLRELKDPASAAAPPPKKDDLNSDDPFTRELAQLDAQLRAAHREKNGDRIRIEADLKTEALARQLDDELTKGASETELSKAQPPLDLHSDPAAPKAPIRPIHWDASQRTSDAQDQKNTPQELQEDHNSPLEHPKASVNQTVGQQTEPKTTAPPTSKKGNLEDRIFSQAVEKMNESSELDRYNVLSHLRSAAASRPEEGDARPEERPSKSEPTFRADLEAVDAPARPITRQSKPAARPIATFRSPSEANNMPPGIPSVPEGTPIMPRRVGAQTPPDEQFVSFIDDVGASTLSELLEAAAAYIHFVEGQEAFTRPQLMTRVRRVQPSGFSREDALRFFGQLLRDGKIEKLRAGKFRVTDEIEFRPL